MMIRILVVDDEEPFRRLLKKELTRKGFSVDVASDAETSLGLLRDGVYDLILLDIVMPGTDGISLMKKLKQDPASPAIIVLTGKATVETAVEAMKHGAYDYLTKPYKLDELVIIINRAYEYGRLMMKNQLLQQELIRQESPFEFIAQSDRLKSILALIKKIAPTDSTVLVQGESGTGKELIARAIHFNSVRKDKPFIAVNCAALNENLLESELFGYMRGAFTGASMDRKGLFEAADTGTIFLDEVETMSTNLQVKLLRVLQDMTFFRVGSTAPTTVDVRVIAATNRDLTEAIREKHFREDLYYRLNVIRIDLPSLRDRAEDIPLLARYFMAKYGKKLDKPIRRISDEAMNGLINHAWPGNIRELENAVERAVVVAETDEIRKEDLPVGMAHRNDEDGHDWTLERAAREHIRKVLSLAGGSKKKAAKLLGVDPTTIWRKLQ